MVWSLCWKVWKLERRKSKVVNKLKVDGGMEKEGGRGKKEGSVKEGLALPLCAPWWRKKKGE